MLWLVGALAFHVMMTPWAKPKSQYFFSVAGYLIPAVSITSVLTLPFTLMSGVIMGIFIVLVTIVRLALLCGEGDLCTSHDGREQYQPGTKQWARNRKWMVIWYVVGTLFLIVGLVLYFGVADTIMGNTVPEALQHGFWHICSGMTLISYTVASSYPLEEALMRKWRNVKLLA